MRYNLKNNKGFSLVEILTALTIGSVILLGVAAFMNGSSVTYKTVTTQVALQDNVQESLNYLTDLLQRSMDVVYDDTNGVMYIFMPTKDTQVKAYEIYYAIYDRTDGNIYIHKQSIHDGIYDENLVLTTSERNALSKNENLLANEVYDFNVDIERDSTTREPELVHVKIGFSKSNKHREATISIRPRNREWTYDSTKPRFYEIINP